MPRSKNSPFVSRAFISRKTEMELINKVRRANEAAEAAADHFYWMFGILETEGIDAAIRVAKKADDEMRKAQGKAYAALLVLLKEHDRIEKKEKKLEKKYGCKYTP